MEINIATFHSSSGTMAQLPQAEDFLEFAFVGRSNVGKSSLINMLCNHKGLAKTSSTPGKTQTVNLFKINNAWYLVDLPGYGYARTPKSTREKFQELILDYIGARTQLKHVFVLIDGRIPLQKIDWEFIEFLITENIDYSIIVTKTDKSKQQEIAKMLNDYKTRITEMDVSVPQIFHTSSVNKKGKDEILEKIAILLQDKESNTLS
jgi:GTP-binding protein